MNKVDEKKGNVDLTNARQAKADEFYTRYDDIELEMIHYIPQFKGKVVYCPADSIGTSNFFKYFKNNFKKLGLKKLVATSYNEGGVGSYATYDGELVVVNELNGNGDFASEECKKIMESCDIVITNPPFSLYRSFITQIYEFGKDFIIMGNMNSVSYKEVFPHIIKHEMTLGPSIHAGDREFEVPSNYELVGTAVRQNDIGTKYIRVKGVRWFTNLPFDDDSIPTKLNHHFVEGYYQKYDNYDAINVNKYGEIPYDYDKEMGVPITVLDHLDADGYVEFLRDDTNEIVKFEIIGQLNSGNKANYDFAKPIIDGTCKFKRILIKKR